MAMHMSTLANIVVFHWGRVPYASGQSAGFYIRGVECALLQRALLEESSQRKASKVGMIGATSCPCARLDTRP